MQIYRQTYLNRVLDVGVVPAHLAGYAPTFENMSEACGVVIYMSMIKHVDQTYL